MASVMSFEAGKYFEFSILMAPNGNREKKFVNTWKGYSVAPGGINDLIGLGRVLTGFHRALATDQVWFHQWSVRTAAVDSDPYNPLAFYTEPVAELGLWIRSAGTHMLDFDVCLRLLKVALPGRNGTAFLRGVLAEQDVNTSAGEWFTTGTELPARWDIAYENVLEPYIDNEDFKVVLALYGPNGEYPRRVREVDMVGVSINKMNHKYYDQGTRNTQPGPELTPEQQTFTQLSNAEWEALQYEWPDEDPVP